MAAPTRRSPRRIIIALASAVAVLAGCATSATLRDVEVTHLTSTSIVENPAQISGLRYLSTGQPNAEVLDAAASAGYVAVVDLRGIDEPRGLDERAEVEARGMRYVSLPLSTPADATYDAAARFATILGDIDGPVLMHCATGNRVGTMFALRARAEGASPEEAMRLGEQAGLTRWRDDVEKIVAE